MGSETLIKCHDVPKTTVYQSDILLWYIYLRGQDFLRSITVTTTGNTTTTHSNNNYNYYYNYYYYCYY